MTPEIQQHFLASIFCSFSLQKYVQFGTIKKMSSHLTDLPAVIHRGTSSAQCDLLPLRDSVIMSYINSSAGFSITARRLYQPRNVGHQTFLTPFGHMGDQVGGSIVT